MLALLQAILVQKSLGSPIPPLSLSVALPVLRRKDLTTSESYLLTTLSVIFLFVPSLSSMLSSRSKGMFSFPLSACVCSQWNQVLILTLNIAVVPEILRKLFLPLSLSFSEKQKCPSPPQNSPSHLLFHCWLQEVDHSGSSPPGFHILCK